MTVVVTDPAINTLRSVEGIGPYPHIRFVMVPGAGHWIQHELSEEIVDEALKTVTQLDPG